jgi:tetratricopeptide (TPR) repeat protein
MTPASSSADTHGIPAHDGSVILAAWERSLRPPDVQALRLLGLFEGPADAGCLRALRSPPPIKGITDKLVELTGQQWNAIVDHLAASELISIERDKGGALVPNTPINCHDLTREYLRQRLLEVGAQAFQGAHLKLYTYLTEEQDRQHPTLDDLLPLYEAVFHGCRAGCAQSAYNDVYIGRINHATAEPPSYYAADTLGAYGTDFVGLNHFVKRQWDEFVEGIDDGAKHKLLLHAADLLQFLGRVDEAVEPLDSALRLLELRGEKDWREMADITYRRAMQAWRAGRMAEAVRAGKQAVKYAAKVKPSDAKMSFLGHSCYGFALFLAGRGNEAINTLPRRIPRKMSEREKWLHTYRSFEVRLAGAERTSWRCLLRASPTGAELRAARTAVQSERKRLRRLRSPGEKSTTAYGMHHLLRGRLALYAAHYAHGGDAEVERRKARKHLQAAIETLAAKAIGAKPVCLESRAWLRALEGDCDAARDDLNEVSALARSGGMVSHLIDALLYRARLFLTASPYPWQGRDAVADLAEARQLIKSSSYLRRTGELRDAERLLRSSRKKRSRI